MADIHVQLRETFRQDLIETVMPDNAPRTGDLGIKIYLQHYLILWSLSVQLRDGYERTLSKI